MRFMTIFHGKTDLSNGGILSVRGRIINRNYREFERLFSHRRDFDTGVRIIHVKRCDYVYLRIEG